MKLSAAIRKAKRQKVIGISLSSISLVLLLMSFVLYFYRTTENDTSILQPLTSLLNLATVWIYQKTQFVNILWEFAPELYYPNIFVDGNLKFLAVTCAFLLGIIMKDSGSHLSQRINKVRKKAEEKIWENTLTGEPSSNNTLTIEIPIEPKDNWYTRPTGIITIAVIGGYIVNLLSKITGI